MGKGPKGYARHQPADVRVLATVAHSLRKAYAQVSKGPRSIINATLLQPLSDPQAILVQAISSVRALHRRLKDHIAKRRWDIGGQRASRALNVLYAELRVLKKGCGTEGCGFRHINRAIHVVEKAEQAWLLPKSNKQATNTEVHVYLKNTPDVGSKVSISSFQAKGDARLSKASLRWQNPVLTPQEWDQDGRVKGKERELEIQILRAELSAQQEKSTDLQVRLANEVDKRTVSEANVIELQLELDASEVRMTRKEAELAEDKEKCSKALCMRVASEVAKREASEATITNLQLELRVSEMRVMERDAELAELKEKCGYLEEALQLTKDWIDTAQNQGGLTPMEEEKCADPRVEPRRGSTKENPAGAGPTSLLDTVNDKRWQESTDVKLWEARVEVFKKILQTAGSDMRLLKVKCIEKDAALKKLQ
ncbi:unnamed protein product [Choristocarpus tenellus]